MKLDAKDSFSTLFELSSEGLCIAKRETFEIIRTNKKLERLLEIPDISNRKPTLLSLTRESNRLDFKRAIERHLKKDSDRKFVCVLEKKDGTTIPCEIRLKAVENNQFLCAINDISDKIRALEDIHLRNVAISSVSSGVTIADARQPDLPLIYVNRGFQQITGYSAKEAVGRSCRFLQGSDRDQPELDILREALRRGESCTVLLRNYKKDESLFYNELHISPVRNDFGDLTHFVGIQLDVTERENSRKILERSEARYRLLANAVDDLIIQRSPDGRIVFASSASTKLIGVKPDVLTGENLFHIVHPGDKDKLMAHSARLLSTGESLPTTFRISKNEGDFRWFESRDTVFDPTSESETPLIVSVLRDITARKKEEQETQLALQREKEINEIKTRFISMVSHEFRTPMTSIQASASLLKEYNRQLSEEKKERHYSNIDISLKRMNRLLNEVLFFSQAEANKLQVHYKPVSLHTYANELVESILSAFAGRKINLVCTIAPASKFLLDVHLLDHILQNLLTNALKYSSPDKAVDFEIKIFEEHLKFKIKDQGIGIPEADQNKLFDAFHRAKNVGTTQGTGLGLNIALRAVELLQGSIIFESQEGVGSTFNVSIPIVN